MVTSDIERLQEIMLDNSKPIFSAVIILDKSQKLTSVQGFSSSASAGHEKIISSAGVFNSKTQKSSGQLLKPVDELRLRNHQLRTLRRKWLIDQRLTPREPLVSPQLSFLQRFQKSEEAFWSRNLKHRAVTHYLEEGKNFVEIPKLMLYKLQRGARNYFLYFMLPVIPAWYFFKYKWSQNLGVIMPGRWPVFPGEQQFDARLCDVQVELKTLKLLPKPDAATDD